MERIDDEDDTSSFDEYEIDEILETESSGENESFDGDYDYDDLDFTIGEEQKQLDIPPAKNLYDYNTYVAQIDAMQNVGEMDHLRATRENMSNIFSLTPELWLSWIRDEIKLATTVEQKAEVVILCERATEEYFSIEVWLEYLQFSIGNMLKGENTAQSVRQLFQRAAKTVGLHTFKGEIIWKAFHEFEMGLFALIDATNVAEKKKQLEHIGDLFHQQLSYPLLNMEKTREEYELWRTSDGTGIFIHEENVLQHYNQAYSKLDTLLSYEAKLVAARNKNEQLNAYKQYLRYEEQQGDPRRIMLLYERAIIDLRPEVTIWFDYLNYLEKNINTHTILDKFYQRALRGFPQCLKLWQKWIRLYEKLKIPELKIQKLLENALSSGFSTADDYRNLWITYLEYLRRKYNEVSEKYGQDESLVQRCSNMTAKFGDCLVIFNNMFNIACKHLDKYFGLDGDPNCIILRYWTRILAVSGGCRKHLKMFRALWTEILSRGHSTTSSYWLEYISLARKQGVHSNVRELYERALVSVKDSPESIANAWIDYEHEFGTLGELEFCEALTKQKLDKMAEERQPVQQISTESQLFAWNKEASERKYDMTDECKDFLMHDMLEYKKCNIQRKRKLEEICLNIDVEADGNQEKSGLNVAPLAIFKEQESKDVEAHRGKQHEVENPITVSIRNIDYTTTEMDIQSEESCEEGVFGKVSDKADEEMMESESQMKNNSKLSNNRDYDEDAANRAETKLLDNPPTENLHDYDTYVALIDRLQNTGEVDHLRAARENMSNIFSLTPELWLSWIRDEIKLATTVEQKAEVVTLCERAVKDYFSVEVWLEYLQFSIGNMGIEQYAAMGVRKLFERALPTVGLHITKGAIIWKACREFEIGQLALIDATSVAEKKEQLKYIGTLFHLQLSCPLVEMEKTRVEYESWRTGDGLEAATDEKNVLRDYRQAYAKLRTILSYENKLIFAQTESEQLDAYKKYLLYEKQQNIPKRIIGLYERAITDLRLEVTIWLDYINFLKIYGNESLLDAVYLRASRSIPRCLKIWLKWMRSYEKWERPESEIQKLLENALSSGFLTVDDCRNLWIAYLGYLRRKKSKKIKELEKSSISNKEKYNMKIYSVVFRNAMKKALEYSKKCFDADSDFIMVRYCMRYYTDFEPIYDLYKETWAYILWRHFMTASYWLDYISFVRRESKDYVRNLYRIALGSVKDSPESIANAWIDFERDEGTLEQMEFCEAKTKETLDKIAEERQLTQQISTRCRLHENS